MPSDRHRRQRQWGPSPTDPSFAARQTSFGGSATAYDACRPGYPISALVWLLGHDPKEVLDVGAGTGILSRAVRSLGHRVVGVEPDESMRAQANRVTPGLVAMGKAEAIPLPDSSFDAVVVGQAWHWFDQRLAEAEVLRVLRPGGVLGVLWNLRDERPAWVRRLGELLNGEDRTTVRGANDGPSLGPQFGRSETISVAHEHRLTVAEFSTLANTWSYVATSGNRAWLVKKAEALATGTATREGTVDLPYVCVVKRWLVPT